MVAVDLFCWMTLSMWSELVMCSPTHPVLLTLQAQHLPTSHRGTEDPEIGKYFIKPEFEHKRTLSLCWQYYHTWCWYVCCISSFFSRKKILADISNVQPTKDRRKSIKKPHVDKPRDGLPNFESFDDYDLVVQTVTPLKTSIPTPSISYHWDKFPTSELAVQCSFNESLPAETSSFVSQTQQYQSLPDADNLSHMNSGSRPITRSLSRLNGAVASSFLTSQSSTSSSRPKRLRQRMNTRLSTSTPEQQKKISRYLEHDCFICYKSTHLFLLS